MKRKNFNEVKNYFISKINRDLNIRDLKIKKNKIKNQVIWMEKKSKQSRTNFFW